MGSLEGYGISEGFETETEIVVTDASDGWRERRVRRRGDVNGKLVSPSPSPSPSSACSRCIEEKIYS